MSGVTQSTELQQIAEKLADPTIDAATYQELLARYEQLKRVL